MFGVKVVILQRHQSSEQIFLLIYQREKKISPRTLFPLRVCGGSRSLDGLLFPWVNLVADQYSLRVSWIVHRVFSFSFCLAFIKIYFWIWFQFSWK